MEYLPLVGKYYVNGKRNGNDIKSRFPSFFKTLIGMLGMLKGHRSPLDSPEENSSNKCWHQLKSILLSAQLFPFFLLLIRRPLQQFHNNK